MDAPPTGSAQSLVSEWRASSATPVVEHHELEHVPEGRQDIYRGREDPPSPSRSRPPSLVASSSSSSTSSGRSGLGLRLGALGTILEMAINRWARTRSDSSTTTSSSSSSMHGRMPRRRRRSSVAASHNTHTENIIRARRKVWEQGRVLPREFVLFLPLALAAQPEEDGLEHPSQHRRVLRSASLPLVLRQLDFAIKGSAKTRKHKQPRILSHGKGKARGDPRIHSSAGRAVAEKSPRRPAWWLDVSSPTWSDMREIGKLLHLHPLTLEDILHQEPREKLEVFSRLGYYFIVFRALDSEHTRFRAQTQLDLTMKGDKATVPLMDGEIGITNVYIVVFREGICTFHFEDISDHILRVRNRIMQFEETFHMSSDWIAHGILDSIVDQFFPLLNSIGREVKDFDDLVLSINGPLRNRRELGEGKVPPVSTIEPKETRVQKLNFVDVAISEKSRMESSFDRAATWSLRSVRPISWRTFYIRRLIPTSAVRQLRQWSRQLWTPEVTSSSSPLVRAASTRRLVTSLARLLGTKSEVVSQIRKRLGGNGLIGLEVSSPEQALVGDVGVYLGDIQDHILTLQQSLEHYERMLSHSHPAYLSHIRVSLAQAKAGMDHKLFMLTLLAVSILAMQLPVGLFSINLGNIPRNNRSADPPAPFNWFMGIITTVLLVGAGVASMTRYWWVQAERKFARARQSKL
ncbi:hypothetical protein JB92DRAFT_2890696 [Gautieria morchelliformis]|nr:hypothetical protein JB92DRAFT_2890696 [Gautieria morchelliformis]